MKAVNKTKDIIDLYEEMLLQRAISGHRPALFVSSSSDLECNMMMLLDEANDWIGVDLNLDSRTRQSQHASTN